MPPGREAWDAVTSSGLPTMLVFKGPLKQGRSNSEAARRLGKTLATPAAQLCSDSTSTSTSERPSTAAEHRATTAPGSCEAAAASTPVRRATSKKRMGRPVWAATSALSASNKAPAVVLSARRVAASRPEQATTRVAATCTEAASERRGASAVPPSTSHRRSCRASSASPSETPPICSTRRRRTAAANAGPMGGSVPSETPSCRAVPTAISTSTSVPPEEAAHRRRRTEWSIESLASASRTSTQEEPAVPSSRTLRMTKARPSTEQLRLAMSSSERIWRRVRSLCSTAATSGHFSARKYFADSSTRSTSPMSAPDTAVCKSSSRTLSAESRRVAVSSSGQVPR
mmetsp:Transcript_117270/g.373557  ORF Transcript_117270/g.373557 Transcript_117270/m.373557 type:complete len:343 (+) Transcript_117270:1435-2463(+)